MTHQPVTPSPSHPAWGYFQHELLYLTWGVMDVALLAPLALSLMSWVRYWPPTLVAVWLLLVMLIPFNLARLMTAVQIPHKRQQSIMVVALLLMIGFSWRTLLYEPQGAFDFSWLGDFFSNVTDLNSLTWTRDVSVFVLTVFVWFRGIRLANRDFGLNRVGMRLRVGGLFLAPLVLLMSNTLTWDVTPFVLLFFLAALTAVALIRVEELEKSSSGLSAALSPRWLVAVFLASLATVLTSGVIGWLVSGRPSDMLAGWLSPLWTSLRMAFATVANTFVFLIFLVLSPFIEWLSGLLNRLFAIIPDDFQLATQPPASELLGTTVPNELVEPVTIAGLPGSRLVGLLIMLAVVLFVALALTRLYQQAILAAREGELMVIDDGRSDGRPAGLGRRLLQQLGLWRNWRAAASIRRIYQQMCLTAESVGYPRGRSDTPYEYQTTLAEVWPSHNADVAIITAAYVKVRYGELPETQEELDAIGKAWQRLKQVKPEMAHNMQPEIKLTK